MDGNTQTLASNIGFFASSLIFFALRIYVRAFKLRTLGSDDYLMIASQAFFVAYLAAQLYAVLHGCGHRLDQLSIHDATEARRGWFFAALMYEPATVLLKLSAGAFILKFTTNKVHRFILWATAIACILIGTLFWFVLLLQCRPIPYWWRLVSPTSEGSCIPIRIFLISGTVGATLNAFADLVYAILPIHLVYNSTWNLRTKVTVCVLLGFGSIAGITTLVRIRFSHAVDEVYMQDGEFLYQSTPLTVLTTAEVGLGITAACAATLRPLFDRGGSQKLQSDPRFTAMLAQGTGALDGTAGGRSTGAGGVMGLQMSSGARSGLASTDEKKEDGKGNDVGVLREEGLESRRTSNQGPDAEKGGMIVHTTVVSDS